MKTIKPVEPGHFRIIAGPDDSFPVIMDNRAGIHDRDAIQKALADAIQCGAIQMVPDAHETTAAQKAA